MHWSGGHASLTLAHLNKEDEGLYTLRVVMGEYYEQYSAYVFVRGKKRHFMILLTEYCILMSCVVIHK